MVTQQIHVDAGGDRVTAATTVTVDTSAVDQTVSSDQSSGLTVPAGETWEIVGLVTTPANVVVEGTLRMRPGATLRFRDVDEAAFVGGDTMAPLASDVGLWMVDEGRLDARGTPKTPWTRAAGAIAAGAASFDVLDASGWLVGDEIVLTATVPRSVQSFWTKDDRRTITAVDGNTVTVDSPLTNAHPSTSFSGATYTAEVLNLTRDVRIEGTPGGRAHVIYLHQGGTALQQIGIAHVELRHLGPSTLDGLDRETGVGGRYALHYHHSHDTTDGIVNDGVVAHDCRSHCFVAHISNGVTFRRCVTHDTLESPYWWDRADVDPAGGISDRVVYDRCVASRSLSIGGTERFTTTGFFLARTSEPLAAKALGCVATGIESNGDSSGYLWLNDNLGVWTFDDCLAHNIRHEGIRVWQNGTTLTHPINRFDVYGCGRGVFHGAYGNLYQYHDMRIHGCGTGLTLAAVSSPLLEGEAQEFHRVTVTDCGTPLEVGDGAVDAKTVTDLRDCSFGQVVLNMTHPGKIKWRDFVDCDLVPDDFTLETLSAEMRIRVLTGGQAWQLTESGAWTEIEPF